MGHDKNKQPYRKQREGTQFHFALGSTQVRKKSLKQIVYGKQSWRSRHRSHWFQKIKLLMTSAPGIRMEGQTDWHPIAKIIFGRNVWSFDRRHYGTSLLPSTERSVNFGYRERTKKESFPRRCDSTNKKILLPSDHVHVRLL